jgi:hypothetical protein
MKRRPAYHYWYITGNAGKYFMMGNAAWYATIKLLEKYSGNYF